MNNRDSELIFDKMNGIYQYLEQIMSGIYDGRLQEKEEILQALGELGKRLIGTQKDFVAMNGDVLYQRELLSKLDGKGAALDKALSETSVSHGR